MLIVVEAFFASSVIDCRDLPATDFHHKSFAAASAENRQPIAALFRKAPNSCRQESCNLHDVRLSRVRVRICFRCSGRSVLLLFYFQPTECTRAIGIEKPHHRVGVQIAACRHDRRNTTRCFPACWHTVAAGRSGVISRFCDLCPD